MCNRGWNLSCDGRHGLLFDFFKSTLIVTQTRAVRGGGGVVVDGGPKNDRERKRRDNTERKNQVEYSSYIHIY